MGCCPAAAAVPPPTPWRSHVAVEGQPQVERLSVVQGGVVQVCALGGGVDEELVVVCRGAREGGVRIRQSGGQQHIQADRNRGMGGRLPVVQLPQAAG